MEFKEEDYLMISALQHFVFCKRQWALIHLEQVWEENQATMEGLYLHEKVDNPYIIESRKNTFISRAVPVSSKLLGISGIIDVIEFNQSENGFVICNKAGLWIPNIVEYKRGKPKKDKRDIVQLVAQVLCLEEQINFRIASSDLYYHETNKREKVNISEELRHETIEIIKEMHHLYNLKKTPNAESYKNCTKCSLYDSCFPRLTKKKVNINNYIDRFIKGDDYFNEEIT